MRRVPASVQPCPEQVGEEATDPVVERVREVAVGLAALLHEAEAARRLRAEVSHGDPSSAVCAWNHFENIPTFYNWNNRPR
ncbi:multiple cyclophane-containing RiPP AmcA [Micromonospora sp. NPDC023888]|uniref:multiple cyclophane-containing RiPP AmcA n=1 Tax=Micromonospora sp. NPDC023888 TaxID=3155607 RepID=UPI0033CA9252